MLLYISRRSGQRPAVPGISRIIVLPRTKMRRALHSAAIFSGFTVVFRSHRILITRRLPSCADISRIVCSVQPFFPIQMVARRRCSDPVSTMRPHHPVPSLIPAPEAGGNDVTVVNPNAQIYPGYKVPIAPPAVLPAENAGYWNPLAHRDAARKRDVPIAQCRILTKKHPGVVKQRLDTFTCDPLYLGVFSFWCHYAPSSPLRDLRTGFTGEGK